MEGARGDRSPAIDRYRIGMRAVDEIRQQEYDKLCSEGRWTSPFAFITEERLRRSEWGSFTAQQIYIRDFLVSRGSDKRRTTEEARAKFAYVYRSGEVRLCTHPGDLEEMTESDDEGLRAQSTHDFYGHSSRLNWRHSLVELPSHQKERERFKAVVEMRKFCFVLVDERIKAELDYFQALPAQARHSIAQTKPAAWHVFDETPGRNSSTASSTISACDMASDEESTGERTLPSPRPSIGYESSATDEDSDKQGSRPLSTFSSPSRNNVTATPCVLSLPNDFKGREKALVDECLDESDSPLQEGHSANSSVAQGFINSAGCSRRRIMNSKGLGRCADGTTINGTSGRGGGSDHVDQGDVMYGAEAFKNTSSVDSCGGSLGMGGGGGEYACAAASGNIRRSTPATTSQAIGLVGEWAATSSVTDGSGSTGFNGGYGSGDSHPNPSEGRFRQRACASTSMWASQQQDYVPNALPPHEGRASPATKTTSVGAGNNHKDKSSCGVSRPRPLTSTYLLSTTTSDSDGRGSDGGGGSGGGNSCAVVREPDARKARSCRSSVETISTGRRRCRLRTRRPVPQSQAKTTLLSDSSSAGAVYSIRSRYTRSRNGDEKASRKEASALAVPLKGGSSKRPSDCTAVSRKSASVMTVSLKSGSKGSSSCQAEATIGDGASHGGARGCMAGVGTGMTNALRTDDAVATKTRTIENVVPSARSPAMNDSACSSGGSQMENHDGGVKVRPGLPLYGALAENGNGACAGLTTADRCLLFGFGSSDSEDDGDSREDCHLQQENKDEGRDANPLRDPCGKEGVLPATANSRNEPKAQPGSCRADRVATSGQLLRQQNLSVQGVTTESKQEAAVQKEAELLRQDSKESLLPPRPKTPPRASESRTKARVARYAASKTEAEVRQKSRGSLLARSKTSPRTSESRAKARVARYAAAKGAAEKAFKDAMEVIGIHNNVLVKLARHQCAEVEVKTAENERANALLHNRLLIADVKTRAAAQNHHLPDTEDFLLCTRVGEVDTGAMPTVTSERHRGFSHDDDVDSVNRPGSFFHAEQPAKLEPNGTQRLSAQKNTTAAAPEAQHAVLSALLLASAHNGRDAAEPAAETITIEAKRAAERAQITAELFTATPPRHIKGNSTTVAHTTAQAAHQEGDYKTKEARTVLDGSSFQEPDAKEKDAMVVASDCWNMHLVYLKRKAFEENAWRVADAGIKSARASIAAEFASIQLNLRQQHATQLAKEERATAKTTDTIGALTRRVSVLEEWKDDQRRIEDDSLEDCHTETACRIEAMRSRNNVRTAARLEAFKKVAGKTNGSSADEAIASPV